MNKEIHHTFTKADLLIMADDQVLGGVQEIEVQDVKKDKLTYITIKRIVIEPDYVVERIRKLNSFAFKLMNPTTHGGWITLNAELAGFRMYISTDDDNSIMMQTLIITTPAFSYLPDVRAEALLAKEKEDFTNLVAIIKSNQEKVAQHKGATAVLPQDEKNISINDLKDEDIVWANVANPEAVKEYVKPRKIKKQKKAV